MDARDIAGAPVAPASFQPQYDSYVTDPLFARRFTLVWVVGTLVFVLLYLPHLYRGLKSGRIWQGWAIYENIDSGYRPLDDLTAEEKVSSSAQTTSGNVLPTTLRAFLTLAEGSLDFVQLRMIRRTNLDIGQVIVLAAYLTTLLVCVIYQAPLTSNSNRAGFLSLAQFPFVFLYAAKSSPLTLLLGRGYEKLNFLHRWAGRTLLLTAIIHGSLWIHFRIVNNERELLFTGSKELRGQASLGLICLIVLTSLGPVRRFAYNFFFAFHTVVTAGFFISVCYHTPFAIPWVIPPTAFYAFDFLARLIRMRFKDAYLEAPDNQITRICIPDVSGGWVAGQHVRIRIFFDGRFFESHPLTIMNAPPSISTFDDPHHTSAGIGGIGGAAGTGMMLAAKSCGDWSAALNALARSDLPEDKGTFSKMPLLRSQGERGEEETVERRVSVMIDGPYGGTSIDFAATSENVLMVAGGSGVTFTLGLLDDLVGRVANERRRGKTGVITKTRRVTFVWCVRSYGAIQWFSRQFEALAHVASDPSLDLQLDFRFFVTCHCDPEAVPAIRNCQVTQAKPVVSEMLDDFISDLPDGGLSGGALGVTASGPESLTSAARNAVAALGPLRARRLGGVELHTEAYTL